MADPIQYVCGCREQLGDGTPALKLATNRPLVCIQDAPKGYSKENVREWFDEAYNRRWAAVCDWKVTFISDWKATFIFDLASVGPDDYVNLITVADLGNGGVLADQMLPYRSGRVLTMRLNSRIDWRPSDGPMLPGTIDPVRVIVHEGGHFMGHQHWPIGAPVEIMEPTISQTIIRPQETEGRMSAAWFGQPVTPFQPPAPQPPTTPGGLRLIQIQVRDIEGVPVIPGFKVVRE